MHFDKPAVLSAQLQLFFLSSPEQKSTAWPLLPKHFVSYIFAGWIPGANKQVRLQEFYLGAAEDKGVI